LQNSPSEFVGGEQSLEHEISTALPVRQKTLRA